MRPETLQMANNKLKLKHDTNDDEDDDGGVMIIMTVCN